MNLKKKCKKALKKLIKNNGNTTTLEVKNYLRKKFPNEQIYQNDIHLLCDEIFNENLITDLAFYNDTKSINPHRVYYMPNTKSLRKRQKINRTDLVRLIKTKKGKFITLMYINKKGGESVTNGQYLGQDDLGYLKIRKPDGSYRNANPQTLVGASISKIKYTVK